MLAPLTQPGANSPDSRADTDLCQHDEAGPRICLGKQARPAFLQTRIGKTMEKSSVLTPHPPEFGRFLFASVGEDRNGHGVTVLSALARLGLDPWTETAELVALGRDAARARLGSLLARFRDVPALASEHARVAGDLSQLLPQGPTQGSATRAAWSVANGHPRFGSAIWLVTAIVFMLLQLAMVGGSVSGE